MTGFLRIVFLYSLLLEAHSAFAVEGLPEITVRTELEGMLVRTLGRDNFLIQVSGEYRTQENKRLLESEVVQQKEPSLKTTQPPDLPGFDVNPTNEGEVSPSEYKKERFEHSETDKLIKLNIHVFYNESLDADAVGRLKDSVIGYLANQLNGKYALSFTPFLPKKLEVVEKEIPWERFALMAASGLLALLAFIWALARIFRRSKLANAPIPSMASQTLSPPAMAIEKSKIASDATRSILLEQFLTNTEAFRVYVDHLPDDKLRALTKLFEGPAFEGMLQALGLQNMQKLKAEAGEIPDEYNLTFFGRDFSEFLKAFIWQRSLFFGFLNQCSTEALITLFREARPLDAAVVARFLQPDRASKILQSLSESRRRELIHALSQAADLPLEKISKIEADVREQLRATPSVGTRLTKSEMDFLTEIVVNSDDQDKILADIQAVAPSSYERLAKLKFSLEDIPALPQDLVIKVLSQLDNDQLALALTRLNESLAGFMLNMLAENRRALVISQMATLADASEQDIKNARLEMASLFRKETT